MGGALTPPAYSQLLSSLHLPLQNIIYLPLLFLFVCLPFFLLPPLPSSPSSLSSYPAVPSDTEVNAKLLQFALMMLDHIRNIRFSKEVCLPCLFARSGGCALSAGERQGSEEPLQSGARSGEAAAPAETRGIALHCDTMAPSDCCNSFLSTSSPTGCSAATGGQEESRKGENVVRT